MNGPNNPIKWCDYTTNPVDGLCQYQCVYCYAARIRKRFHMPEKVSFRRNWFNERQAARFFKKEKRPPRIFVGSAHDIFGPWVTDEWIWEILCTAKIAEWSIFQFLTKNPMRLQNFKFEKNMWLGTTIEDAKYAQKMIDLALVRHKGISFISFEPLLTPMDKVPLAGIDWIILGGLTGRRYEYDPEWVKDILKRAKSDGIPVFIKDNLKWKEKIQNFPIKIKK